MKKVLLVITKSNWGGAQRYVHDLAIRLPQEGYKVSVAAGGTGTLKQKLRDSGIDVIDIPSLQRDISFIKELRSIWEMAQIVRRNRPDILHLNSSKAGIIGALIGRIFGVPKIIFTSHGWAFNEQRPWWQRLLFKTFHYLNIILSHKTITVSNELKIQMNWPGVQNKMQVVHNGREINSLFNKEEARHLIIEQKPGLKIYQNDFWSVTIAELHPIKQHDVFIRAFKDIAKTHPTARHLIIGDGQDKSELNNLIKDLGLSRNVFLLGHIDEAAKLLKAFGVFVLPSRSEALAYVLIEACIASLPVIASRVGGIPEIIRNQEEGYLVESGDQKALIRAYENLIDDQKLREQMSHKALVRATNFTLEKMLKHTILVYESKI